MILIAHRGNIKGRIVESENNPKYIDEAIVCGYDVEIDLRVFSGELHLGHYNYDYKINNDWLQERWHKLWIHCKNEDSVNWIIKYNSQKSYQSLHWFWHEKDTLTLTSKGIPWVYPGNQPIIGSVSVLPELHNDNVTMCSGICSDFIENYKSIV